MPMTIRPLAVLLPQSSPAVGGSTASASSFQSPLPLLLLAAGGMLLLFALMRMAKARREARQLLETARAEAEARAKTIELEAERRATQRRTEVDAKVSKALAEIQESQARAARREEALDRKMDQLGQREQRLDDRDAALKTTEARHREALEALDRERGALRDRLATIAGMTQEEARRHLLEEVRQSAEREAALLRQQVVLKAEAGAREQAREILLMSIQRYAGECSSDSTVRSIKVPSEDLKGRVIGREGRNIRHFEKVTGVDVLIDDTPGVIAVSCFDRVRQAVAAEALQKLVNDGRIHPARIDEVVSRCDATSTTAS